MKTLFPALLVFCLCLFPKLFSEALASTRAFNWLWPVLLVLVIFIHRRWTIRSAK